MLSILFKDLEAHVSALKESFPSLTDFEALQIAVKREQTETFRRAFAVSPDNSVPAALEAIAITLGFNTRSSATITEALTAIADKIGSNE